VTTVWIQNTGLREGRVTVDHWLNDTFIHSNVSTSGRWWSW